MRRSLANDNEFIQCISNLLKQGTMEDYQWHDLREAVLHILLELTGVKQSLLSQSAPMRDALEQLRVMIKTKLESSSDASAGFNEMLKKELDLILKVSTEHSSSPDNTE